MIEARRRAYLEALGLDVWLTRPTVEERGCLAVNDGRGSTLLVCPSSADCLTDIAADVARALGGDPVWAWLDPPPAEGGERLEHIITHRLITRVLLLGLSAERSLFQGDAPGIVGSATVSVAPSLDDLASSASARKSFWDLLWKPRQAANRADSR